MSHGGQTHIIYAPTIGSIHTEKLRLRKWKFPLMFTIMLYLQPEISLNYCVCDLWTIIILLYLRTAIVQKWVLCQFLLFLFLFTQQKKSLLSAQTNSRSKCTLKTCLHGPILTVIYLLQLMGHIGFSAIINIALCKHWIPNNPLVEEIRSRNRTVWTVL